MAVFRFTVNQSFLKNVGHPITVPKSQVPYPQLEAEKLHKTLTIIFPRGERYDGLLYRGEAGYGEYYQIQMRGSNRQLPSYVKDWDRLFIVLCKSGARTYATLEYKE